MLSARCCCCLLQGYADLLWCCCCLLQGYAERKVLLLCDVVKAAKELHTAGAKQERAKLQASFRQVRGLADMHP